METSAISVGLFCALFLANCALRVHCEEGDYIYGRVIYNEKDKAKVNANSTERRRTNSTNFGTVITSEDQHAKSAHSGAFEKVRQVLRESDQKIGPNLTRDRSDGYSAELLLAENGDAYVDTVNRVRRENNRASGRNKLHIRSVAPLFTEEGDVQHNKRVQDWRSVVGRRENSNLKGKLNSDPGVDDLFFSPEEHGENHPAFYPHERIVDAPSFVDNRFRPSDDSYYLSHVARYPHLYGNN